MLPLNLLNAMLEGGISKEEETELIKENAKDGEILRRAAQEGLVNVVKFLLDAASGPELTVLERLKCSNEGAADGGGTTPLHLAAAGGHSAVVEALIATGACVDVTNAEKDTPLTLACQGDHEGVVNILLRYYLGLGDDIEIESALKFAIMHSRVSIVNSLLNAGARTDRALYDAADVGREDVVQLLLDHIEDRNGSILNQMAFCRAAAKGHLGVCRLLFERQGLFEVGVIKEKPLHRAAERGFLEVVHFLLASGVEADSHDLSWRRPMHYATEAGHLEIVSALLSSGACIDARDKEWRTPLHCASSRGHVEIVQYLLVNNAEVDAIDRNFSSPLDVAIENGYRNVALLLFSRGSPLNKKYLLNSAVQNGRTLAVLCLFQTGVDVNPSQGLSPLHIACGGNRVDYATALLEKGASVNAQNDKGDTPLHIACQLQNCEAIIHVLLKHGASVDIVNRDNLTPLAMAKYVPVQKFLIKNGADVHIPDDFGCSLLHKAEDFQLVQQLLQQNALVDARDVEGSTPLLYTCGRGHASIARLLITHGALVNTKNKRGEIPLENAILSANADLVKILLENGAESNAVCSNGETPLHYTTTNDVLEIAGLLLKYNADVNATDEDNMTPLHSAVEFGDLDAVHFFIDHGAQVNAADVWGRTPLHLAAARADEELVSWLLECGGDALIQDSTGETPLDAAIKASRSRVAEILTQHVSKLNV